MTIVGFAKANKSDLAPIKEDNSNNMRKSPLQNSFTLWSRHGAEYEESPSASTWIFKKKKYRVPPLQIFS